MAVKLNLYRTKLLLFSIFALVSMGIGALVFVLLSGTADKTTTQASVQSQDLSHLTVLHIGGGNLASQVVERLAQQKATVVPSTDLPSTEGLGPQTVVVFAGEWFEQRMDNAALHDFLRNAASRGARLVMVGGTTSRFFEVLDKAGVHKLIVTETGVVRNPAYFNPPQVGYKKVGQGEMAYPNLLFSNSSDPNVLAEAFSRW